jgi:hypothetical protein
MLRRASRWASAHRFGLLAAALIAAAAGIRVGLLAAGWPGSDSDDATMGLMAKHILERGEHPIFFYGQAYMGTIEAYLGALMFALFGVSMFALKCGLIVLYSAFLAAMYGLLSLAFDRRWALIGLIILGLGGEDMLYHQLEAYGGYLETLLFGTLVTLLAAWLVRTAGDPARRRKRMWGYAAWGLAAGLGVWSDPLVVPFVVLSALALLLLCGREVRGRLGLLAVLGLLVGLAPWGIYLATAPSLDVARSFLVHPAAQPAGGASGGGRAPAAGPGPLEVALDHVLGTVVISVPNNTGATSLCQLDVVEAWPPQHWTAPRIRSCIALRAVWGGGFLLLLAAALVVELGTFWTLWRMRWRGKWSPERRLAAGRATARAVALAAPAVTVVLFACSSVSAFSPWNYSRYLISIAVALPVLGATLWEHAPPLAAKVRGWRGTARLRIAGMLALLVIALAAGVAQTYGAAEATQAHTQREQDLVAALERSGDTRFYSEYWTCLRTIFLSNEGVICSVVNAQFDHAPSRYPPYDAIVRAAPHPAYVFPLDVSQAKDFPDVARRQGWRVESETVDNEWVIYRIVGG